MRPAPFRPCSFASRAFTRFAFFGNWLSCGLRRLDPVALRRGLSPVLPLVRQLAVMRLAPFRPCSFASRAFTRFALCGNWLPCGLCRLGPIALRHGLSPVLPLGGMKFPKTDRQENFARRFRLLSAIPHNPCGYNPQGLRVWQSTQSLLH
jgi:hypothetical protein